MGTVKNEIKRTAQYEARLKRKTFHHVNVRKSADKKGRKKRRQEKRMKNEEVCP